MKIHVISVLAAFLLGSAAHAEPLLEFNGAASEAKWKTVNDNVMGGKSKGGFRIDAEQGVLVFSGSTNTDGGGFSSIRTEAQDWNMGDAAGIEIRLRSDARTYMADLRKQSDRRWIPVAYRAQIDADRDAEGWQTVRIPFDAFKPTRMGRAVEADPIRPEEVGAIGFMIYDKQDGPFTLEVDWIGTYRVADPGDMPPLGR